MKGPYCQYCHDYTPTSIHGRCVCGYQKFPSTVLEKRAKPTKPFIIRPKPAPLEEMEEIKKFMRSRPHYRGGEWRK